MMAALEPPTTPGVDLSANRAPGIIIDVGVLMGLTLVCMGGRLVSWRMKEKPLGVSDWILLASLFFTLATSSLTIYGT